VGVIIGPDLAWRDGQLITDPSKRSKQDRSIRGYKSQAKSNPEIHDRVDRITRNTYKTLMSRGMKGCYVYICDRKLERRLDDCFRPLADPVGKLFRQHSNPPTHQKPNLS